MLRHHLILFVVSVLGASTLADAADIRLVGGDHSCSGRVEIYHNGQWGTVCDDSWDLNDAHVVCKQLECGKAVTAFGSAHFQQGSGKIWLDDVGCSGSESSITQCSHREFGKHDCNHGEDAGVECTDQNLIRLVNGLNDCCGRVEIKHDGRWGTVCDDNWDINDAQVVCRQLGCGRAVKAPGNAHFGQGQDLTWLDEVQCTGGEAYITQCPRNRFGDEDCGHSEDAGVVCLQDIQVPTLTLISSHSAVSTGEIVQFRCATPSQTCIPVDFSLYKNGSVLLDKTAQSTATFTLTASSSHEGVYSCDYKYREINSASSKSNSINIIVVILQQPSITFSSAVGSVHQVMVGQNFSIICSTKPQYPGGSFQLKFSGSSVTRTQSAVSHSAIFSFPVADFVHQGTYSCFYEVTVSSRTFHSTATDILTITVTVILEQPEISFNDADGSFQWGPQRPEVTVGQSFSIICSTKPQYPGGSFHLEFDGSITRTKSAINHSAIFLFPEVDFVHQGNYSCSYEVTVSSRTFRSTATDLMTITVRASLLNFIVLGSAAGLLLILVPVIVCCVLARRRSNSQLDKKEQRECVQNTYDSRQEEHEMNDSNDYENVDPALHQTDDDSESDYMNVGVNHEENAKYNAQPILHRTEDSDSESNYMNVDENWEQNAKYNAQPILHRTEDSDSDSNYINVDEQKMLNDNDYEDEQVYATCT